MATVVSRYTDPITGFRHYEVDDHDVLSVTTILGFLNENTRGLDIWKSRNSGYGDDADHRHLFWYKTLRGTLAHYNALSRFVSEFGGEIERSDISADSLPQTGNMWGGGEQEALDGLREAESGTITISDDDGNEWQSDAWEVHYSILKDKGKVNTRDEYHESSYADETIMDELRRDIQWFWETFNEITDLMGVDEDSVLAVEEYILNIEYGFGGQADLIYEDVDGNTVLADLKTSSGLRRKHRIQATAYARGIDMEIDRVEVWRLHPDTETWEIHSPTNATEYHTTDGWYKDPYGDFNYEDDDAIWEDFTTCIEEAYEVEADHQERVQDMHDRLANEHV